MILWADEKADLGSSISETSCVKPSASLLSVYRGVLGWTIDIHSADNSGEGTDKPEQGTSFSIGVFKKSNKEKATDYDVTRFESGKKKIDRLIVDR